MEQLKCVLIITFLLSGAIANAQNLVNGSFTDMTGNSVTPNGWTNVTGFNPGSGLGGFPTVDVLDINFTAFGNNAGVTVAPSPNGGTWTGLSSIPPNNENEAIEQVVSGFTIGTIYELSFYAANFGGTPFIDPGVVTGYVNGMAVAVSPTLNLVPNVWTFVTGTFVASATSMTIQIDVIHNTGDLGIGGYYDVDGLTVSPVVCGAGTNQPNLSQVSACLTTPTYNLSGITASNAPPSTSLTWHSATPATNANTLANISAVTLGTYYASFYDAVNDCYGPTRAFTVNPIPTAAFGVPTVCSGNSAAFTDQSTTPAGTINNWSWDFDDGGTSVVQNPSHTYHGGAANYTITLTVTTAQGCSNSTSQVINVNDSPVAAFDFAPHDLDIFHTAVEFTNNSVNGISYSWDFGGFGGSTQTDPSFTFPEEAGSYTVTLITYSALCNDTARATIIIRDILIYFVPNSFTPDGDEFNQTFQPVFSSGFDPYDFNLQLFNRWGETIFESNDATIGWDGTYNGKLVPDGIYSWRIEFKTSETDERVILNGNVNKLQ